MGGRGGTVDMTAPLPEEDTPRIERNKQHRAGAMAAIINGNLRRRRQQRRHRGQGIGGRVRLVAVVRE